MWMWCCELVILRCRKPVACQEWISYRFPSFPSFFQYCTLTGQWSLKLLLRACVKPFFGQCQSIHMTVLNSDVWFSPFSPSTCEMRVPWECCKRHMGGLFSQENVAVGPWTSQTLHKPQWPHSSLIRFLILHSLLSCFPTLQSWTWWNCVQEWKCPHKSDPTLHGLLPAISLVQSLCNVWLSPGDSKAGNCLENLEWKWVSCVLPPARYNQALPFT